MQYDYYYGSEAEQFSFIRIPKIMLIDESFSGLSLPAKILYGVLLDRMALSVKNGWLDENKRVFIIFTIEEIQDILGFSKKKSIEYLNELEEFGLVEKRRRGLGLPSILYIKSFMSIVSENGTSRGVEIDTSVQADNQAETSEKAPETPIKRPEIIKITPKDADFSRNLAKFVQESCVRSVEMGTSGGVEIALQEVPKSTLQEVPKMTPQNNTNINNTYLSETESHHIVSRDEIRFDAMSAYSEIIKEHIELEYLKADYPYDRELLDGIFELILETVLSTSPRTVVASNEYPTELVKSKFLKLNSSHIRYVLDCLQQNTTKVKNIKKYMLAALFNAPTTIDGYYQAEVHHDMPELAMRRGS